MNYKICSGSCLKLIAICSMLVDHTASHVLRYCDWATTPWYTFGHLSLSPYFLMRSVVGRIGFPIFAFLIAEGYRHTRNKQNYVSRLLAFAILTEPIWDLVHQNTIFSLRGQNVLFTLALGVAGMWLIDTYKEAVWKQMCVFAGVFVTAFLLRCDYGIMGVALIMLYHIFAEQREAQMISTAAAVGQSYYSVCALLAMIPIGMYNGERGFISGPLGKYLFYIIYPLHLLILYAVKVSLFGN